MIKRRCTVLVLICSAGGLILSAGISRYYRTSEKRMRDLRSTLIDLNHLDSSVRQLVTKVRTARGGGAPLPVDETVHQVKGILDLLAELQTRPLGRDHANAFKAIDRKIRRLAWSIDGLQGSFPAGSAPFGPTSPDTLDDQAVGLLQSLSLLNQQINRDADASLRMLNGQIRTAHEIWWIAGLTYLVIVIVLWRWTVLTVVRPLGLLITTAEESMERNKPFQHVERGPIGVRQLTRTIGKFAGSLEDKVSKRTVDLVSQKQKLESEIAERKVLEGALRGAKEAAESASRAKSEFLANMSHELRTPLNGVVGMIELLRGTELEEQQRRYADICRTSADSLLSLINDILDLSKIEAGKFELDHADFDLRTVVEDVAEVFAQKAASKGLELVCSVDPKIPPMVRGDKDRLRQILINLVNNAIKFTELGEVVLRVWPEQTDDTHVLVRTSVKDTGIGISEDQMDRLFKTFSQLDSSRTKKFGGTGLGLAICKRLSEMMDGQIGVESDEGKGSTFWFTARLEIQHDHKAEQVIVPADLRGMRVLIVDDNATNRLILFEQVVGWEMEAETAESGIAALQLLKHAAASDRQFDLALLDMAMPNMDGLQLAEAVHNRPEFQPIAMVMLTSFDDMVDKATRDNVGIDSCLRKPTRQADVFTAVINAVSRSRSVERESAPATSAADPVEGAESTSVNILIAEDNEVNQIVTSEIVKKAGYMCDVVADGKAAVDAIRNESYGLVLMDCQMPEMDGFEATQAIRKLEREGALSSWGRRRIPIVALTANAIKGDRERCLEAGMDDYLAKPIDPNVLMKTIKSFIRGDSQADETPDQVEQVAETPADENPPFNAQSLLGRCMNDAGFVGKILSKFETEAAALVDQLDQSIASDDADQTGKLAHSIKGTAASLSAESLRAVAADLEAVAQASELGKAQKLVKELRGELDKCLNFIPKLRQQMAEEKV